MCLSNCLKDKQVSQEKCFSENTKRDVTRMRSSHVKKIEKEHIRNDGLLDGKIIILFGAEKIACCWGNKV